MYSNAEQSCRKQRNNQRGKDRGCCLFAKSNYSCECSTNRIREPPPPPPSRKFAFIMIGAKQHSQVVMVTQPDGRALAFIRKKPLQLSHLIEYISLSWTLCSPQTDEHGLIA